jgi:hypothetical protein
MLFLDVDMPMRAHVCAHTARTPPHTPHSKRDWKELYLNESNVALLGRSEVVGGFITL